MAQWEKRFKRPCPRVALDPRNAAACQLLTIFLGPSQPLVTGFGAGFAHYHDEEEFLRLYRRVSTVLSNAEFRELIKKETSEKSQSDDEVEE